MATILAGHGCSSDSAITSLPETQGRLRGVTILYARAARQLGRGPKNREELLAPLAGKNVENPDELLRSPRDNEHFEIVWGLDLAGRDSGYAGPIAYERTGVEGQRMCVTTMRQFSEVSAAELRKLPFPPKYEFPEGVVP